MGKEYKKKVAAIISTIVIISVVFMAIVASAFSSEAVSEGERRVEAMPNEVIVCFKDVMTVSAAQESLVARHGGKILDKEPALNCVLVRVNDVKKFIKEIARESAVAYAEPNYIAKATYTPNDPLYDKQWGLLAIKADKAWDVQMGNKSVKIAIVDTGIDYTHEDLNASYVSGGYDFVNNDNDPMDDNGHGTHCAGIAAAVIDNGKGIAGVAQVSIMAEKVLDRYGYGSNWNVARGIVHATQSGANVISMSLGSSSFSRILQKACLYAWRKGCILVAAAGNDGVRSIDYPARFKTVICVGSIDRSNSRSSFSNYGPQMELVAPGEYILSTYPGNMYVYKSGTSMATPHVAGVAALVWSHNPTLRNRDVRIILARTADDLGTLGWDKEYGFGRVDAEEAVNVASTLSTRIAKRLKEEKRSEC